MGDRGICLVSSNNMFLEKGNSLLLSNLKIPGMAHMCVRSWKGEGCSFAGIAYGHMVLVGMDTVH